MSRKFQVIHAICNLCINSEESENQGNSTFASEGTNNSSKPTTELTWTRSTQEYTREMAFFRVYPGQAETTYHHPSSRDVFGDALLAGLSQGMSDLEQLLGPYHRARSCPNTCKSSRETSGAATRKPTRRVPTTRDPPAAWMWWMLGGGDSSDSEEEGSGAPESSRCEGSCPRGRRQCPAEESCAMKRKPSRSASNAPPTKKKEERKSEPDTEDAPKFNFTGKKTNDKRK